MARALVLYRDVGPQYMLMPDHVPQIDGRDPAGVAFAYCYGYIQALIDALGSPQSPARDAAVRMDERDGRQASVLR
jgi:D-mannonate dehydratase